MIIASSCVGVNAVDTEPSVEARQLLQRVREALPDIPLHLNARYQSKDRKGRLETSGHIDIHTDWGSTPPEARYIISDLFGEEQERLDISWKARGKTTYQCATGSPPVEIEISDLSAPIGGMDFSWADLSFSFLWWEDARLTGMEKKKGRMCHVVDLIAPNPEADTYAGVRLWIDPEINMLLQAEGYNRENDRIRRLKVKSFKKIDEMWTIQDIDIQSFPSRHKTLLRVRDLKTGGKSLLEEGSSDRILPVKISAP